MSGVARGRQGPARRRRRRRGAVARPDHAAARAHEARRRAAAAPAHDGGDGAAGLRPVRLHLRDLFRRARPQEGGAAEPVRARRQGHAAHAQEAQRGTCRRHRLRPSRRRRARTMRSRRRPRRRAARPDTRATIRSRRRSVSARASTSPAPRRRRGTSTSISTAAGSTTRSATASASLPTNDPALVDAVIARARRAGRFPDRRPHAARGAARRRVAVARARHAVPAVLLPHRRRPPAQGEGAGGRRGPGRRRRDARRAGGAREIPRRAARSRSLHRGARAAAAAALFDLVLAQGRAPAACRSPSMRCATTSTGRRAARRRLDLPAPSASSPATRLKVYVQKAHALRPAGRSGACRSSWSGPAPASRRSAPSCTSAWPPRRPAATGCSSAISARDYDFFYADELAGMKADGRAHPPVARLVARRRREVLRAGPHAPGPAATCGLARRRRALLRLRRRQAHGQGRRARAGRHRGAARRAHHRRGGGVRRRAQEATGRYQQDVY